MNVLGVCSKGYIETSEGVTRGRKNGDYLYYRGIPVHRLVMNVFEPKGYHHHWMDRVDHINQCTEDNDVDNLRWSNSILNGLNSCRMGNYAKRPKCYVVQIRVISSRHACSVHTVQDAIYLAYHANRTTFRNLECLYKFLAAHDAPAPERPHEWLRRRFGSRFLRRLSGLPAKKQMGRRRTII